MFAKSKITLPLLALPLLFGAAVSLHADFFALDPGVRGDPAGAGGPIDGLSDNEKKFFEAGLVAFTEIQDVQGDDPGLGPRFNLDNCAGCHAQPAVGGSSPFTNPQVAVATKANAKNDVPPFITIDGPVREARFKFKPDGTRDGGVHPLFTITGRDDAPGCFLAQPDFATAAAENNLVFRIPTPAFGAGLIQAIDEPGAKVSPLGYARGRIALMMEKATPEQRKHLEAKIAEEWKKLQGDKPAGKN